MIEIDERIARFRPSSWVMGRDIGVIGNLSYFCRGGIYGKVAKHCGMDAKPAREVGDNPVAFVLWMNGILGDGWGWSRSRVQDDIAWARENRPGIPVLGSPDFNDDKLVVERNFESVFGRSLSVDPRVYNGLAVKKSRIQARHDGQVVTCPIDPNEFDEKCSYQKLIDNTSGESVVDIRAVVVGWQVTFCYVKYRPILTRFANINSKVFLVAPRDVLSNEEIGQVNEFARRSLLEIGEIDVLRDNASGLIYVVDANNTPAGPPNGLSPIESEVAIRLLSDAFLSAVERRARGAGTGEAG